MLVVMASAEEVKMALLQPLTTPGSTACNPMEISMVRGELRKAFGWQSDFQVLTRLDVDAMLKEQGFQRSGMVDDNQRKQVGIMTGAQYICVSSITKYGTQLYIESYLVDVETGQMTNPASQYINVKDEDYSTLPAACGELAKEMLGEIAGTSRRSSKGAGVVSSREAGKDYVEDVWGINMKMIWVEGGEFMMGYDAANTRRVTLDGFYIGMLEVTQSQWEKVMGTTVIQLNNEVNNDTKERYPYTYQDLLEKLRGVGADYPMYHVTWFDAVEFCRRLSEKTGRTYALPTEAQWEYAARGGKNADGTIYAGSNVLDEVAWCDEKTTHPCGTKRANSLGIYDMSGNVWEWCSDWFGEKYINYDTHNPTGPKEAQPGQMRVKRGGSWKTGGCCCKVSYRSGSGPYNDSVDWGAGFRIVCIP